MGKLRTAINGLTTLIVSFEAQTDGLLDEVTAQATNVQKGLERTYGGLEVLYMYLTQKAKKEGSTIKAWAKDEIKAHLDSEVAGFIKGIESARNDTLKAFEKQNATVSVKVKALQTDIERAQDALKDIRGQVDKKKKKWLLSKTYKAKLLGYEKLLDGLESQLKGSIKANADALPHATAGSQATLNKLKITASTKVSALEASSWLGIRKELDGIAGSSGKELSKKFKRYGAEIKQLREWLGEADAMEAEADK
jgi:hypothetical protein